MKEPLIYVIDPPPTPDNAALFRRGFAQGAGLVAAITLWLIVLWLAPGVFG